MPDAFTKYYRVMKEDNGCTFDVALLHVIDLAARGDPDALHAQAALPPGPEQRLAGMHKPVG